MQIKQKVHLPMNLCVQEGILENTVTLIHSHLKHMSHLFHVFQLISLHKLTPITDAYQWNAHSHLE